MPPTFDPTRRQLLTGLLATGGALLSGCEDTPADYQPGFTSTPPVSRNWTLSFGVHPLHNPQRLFEAYQPLVSYMTEHLPGLALRLEASRNYPEYERKLYAGHFDLALPNPLQTVQALDKGYRVFGKVGDDRDFCGILLVRRDSGIDSAQALRGKSVSYPARTALAATLLPQWVLHQHGINLYKDIHNLYVGSQESSIMNVYRGHTAAGATWPVPWRKFQELHPEQAAELKILWQSETLPNNSLMAHERVAPARVEQIAQLLFHLHENEKGRQVLAGMGYSHFETANAATYRPVREFIERFESEIGPIGALP